jgi:hypothetical protein
VLHLHDAESNVLEIEQITIDGERASLMLGSKVGGDPADGGPICTTTNSGAEQCTPSTTMEGWHSEAHATMTGTAQRRDTGFVLDFQRPELHAERLRIECTEQWFDVAPATAVITRPHCAWSVATERTKVLGCVSLGETTPYAPSPGIEQVDPDHETTRCDGRPMYRRVPGDGSVAQALAR